MDNAIVFNIQRFCLQDGPGIRTVVFLKGCPLRCKWCSNPESQSYLPEIMYFKRLCLTCGTCIALCPNKAISLKEKQIIVDKNKCDACGICAKNCKANALRLSGESYTSDELFDIITRDQNYFELSNGGVTFSGGEPLMQPFFLKSILKKLKIYNIRTAIETSGFVHKDVLGSIAEYTDMFLYDIKHISKKKHEDGTGKGNIKILNNLRYLTDIHENIVVRIPIIPGYNMNKSDLNSIIDTISTCGIRNVQLIPYHNYGLSKYESIQKKYEFNNVQEPKERELKELLGNICTDVNIEILYH